MTFNQLTFGCRIHHLFKLILVFTNYFSQVVFFVDPDPLGRRALEGTLAWLNSGGAAAFLLGETLQGSYYAIGSEIARLEEAIQYARESRRQHEADLVQARQSLEQAKGLSEQDNSRLAELAGELERDQPMLDEARANAEAASAELQSADVAMQDWQAEWDRFNQSANEPSQLAQVERTRDPSHGDFATNAAMVHSKAAKITADAGAVSLAATLGSASSITAAVGISIAVNEITGIEGQTGPAIGTHRSPATAVREAGERVHTWLRAQKEDYIPCVRTPPRSSRPETLVLVYA